MDPTFQPLAPAPTPSAEAPRAETKTTSGTRRAVLTAAISGLLLVAGGVAVVSAASPEPSASPSTTAPSGGTTAPSDGTTTPRTHSGVPGDCPDKAGFGQSHLPFHLVSPQSSFRAGDASVELDGRASTAEPSG